MLSRVSFFAGFVLSAALFARADVTPSEPGPGSAYNAGSTCTVSWEGDPDSTTAWKDMSIQLMTGDNFNMIHLSTIASEQDGTVDGRFNYPCPEVTPYSAIYFYQFTAAGAPDKTWTTRFTIASPTGQTVPPPNAAQPGTNDPIPWGAGALADPSTANPPPTAGPAATGGTARATTSSSTSTAANATTSGLSRTSTGTGAPTATRNTTAAASQTADSGALATVGHNIVLGSVLAIASSLLAVSL
ncbi:hypothetical protein EST38_g9545 [Candolleomyces aberdarensis]|uniref:Yeast cell wall synthesis Kre9/Knh1-like N-terminal domain-containing protein n=1 Tax=Candolleomyces aberdarensis TaxID=2316362 RepID=A0A4Q2DBV6_9AGAR|nr:hypothetical protein EST38_g9545 [Candolleomyces aberdarensis]